jgi:hypothetical protein
MKNSTKKYILFDADPFCFGPISTAINVAQYLKDDNDVISNYELVLIGTGTSLQLGSKSNIFDHIVECDTTKEEYLKSHEKLFLMAHIFISVLNTTSISYVKGKTRSVYIDVLFWMWNDIPVDLKHVDLLFLQNFFGVKEKIEKFSDKISNPIIVNPIIHPYLKPKKVTKRKILLSFGGIDTAYEQSSGLYVEISKIIANNYEFKPYNFVVAGGGSTIKKIKSIFNTCTNVICGTFERSEFLSHMSDCEKAIVNPGLTTHFEVEYLQKPCFYLPPNNYSQALQLNIYKNTIDNFNGFDFSNQCLYPVIENNLLESHGIRKVYEAIDVFLNNTEEKKRFAKTLSSFLKLNNYRSKNIHARKQNGTNEIVSKIKDMVITYD